MNEDLEPSDQPPSRRWGRRGNRGPAESIATGVAIFVGFSIFWFFNQHTWWILFPALFGGLIPIVRGISRLIEGRVSAPRDKRKLEAEKAANAERSVLRIAQARSGLVTPSQVALDTQLSLEEAELLLDSMAKRGHASMEVREDGRLVYRFSEFLLPEDSSPRLE
jgi:hypothetical protein